MAKFKNYDFYTDFSGHSVVTTDEKGIIVETALPFQKFIGKSIDDLFAEYGPRKSFNDIKELGTTKDGILKSTNLC